MMKSLKVFMLAMLGTWGVSLTAQGQIDMPQASPICTVSQKVGLMDVTLVYSRPSARGRKIFGDVVAYDKLWRTGANMASRIQFNDSVRVNGVGLKGDYSILTIPSMNEWTIILNKVARMSGTSNYKESEDAVRIKVKPDVIPFTETFTIGFNYLTNNSAFVEISWETTRVSFKFETDVDAKVMRNIEQALSASSTSYFQAARYYYETNRDMNQALEWIDLAIAKEKDELYWVVRQKALIQAKLGDYPGAIATAQRSLELAKKAGNDDYVRMNQTSIDEWRKK
jgi:tetratricopeptide (TPR) repeat protein